MSHLFGRQAGRVTCVSSPGGRRGQQPGQENQDEALSGCDGGQAPGTPRREENESSTTTVIRPAAASWRRRQRGWREREKTGGGQGLRGSLKYVV